MAREPSARTLRVLRGAVKDAAAANAAAEPPRHLTPRALPPAHTSHSIAPAYTCPVDWLAASKHVTLRRRLWSVGEAAGSILLPTLTSTMAWRTLRETA